MKHVKSPANERLIEMMPLLSTPCSRWMLHGTTATEKKHQHIGGFSTFCHLQSVTCISACYRVPLIHQMQLYRPLSIYTSLHRPTPFTFQLNTDRSLRSTLPVQFRSVELSLSVFPSTCLPIQSSVSIHPLVAYAAIYVPCMTQLGRSPPRCWRTRQRHVKGRRTEKPSPAVITVKAFIGKVYCLFDNSARERGFSSEHPHPSLPCTSLLALLVLSIHCLRLNKGARQG